jgi:diguanylate cyclase (GGDEF)-like protein/putative nucleotidyltransferase with HDIG domain
VAKPGLTFMTIPTLGGAAQPPEQVRPAPSRWLTPYVLLVVAVGWSVMSWRLLHATFPNPLLFFGLLASSILISVSKVHLPIAGGSATLSMSYFTDFMALVLTGPDAAMVIAGASGATQCVISTRGRASVRQTLFSVAALVLTIQSAGLVSAWLGGFSVHDDLSVLAKPAVGAAAAFFVCNSWLVAGAVALSRRERILNVWHESFLWTAPACFIAAGVAVVAVRVVMTMSVWTVLLVGAPLYLTYRSYRIYLGRVEDHQHHLREVSDLHLASVEALARAIDARDQTIDRSASPADNHIRRVQAMAASLAAASGMAPDEIEGVKVAALLHDIGKLAVPEHILTKPGRLTPDEFDRVRIHPTIGAEIIRAVPFPYPVAPYIQSHHERWDGSGYPDGLRGEAIPLGARVLAVVDYYDALTTNRPYHAAIGREPAIEVLRSESGKALDPALVTRFIEMLPEVDLRDDGSRVAGASSGRAGARTSAPVTGFSMEADHVPSVSDVFQNISRATQEMHALYDIAQTLGTRLSVNDSMALLTSKLNPLVPASCWALYTYESESQLLQCRFASALDAETVERLRIPLGEGASGWAARHRSPAVNARAAADFEAANLPDAGRTFESVLAYPLIDGEVLVGTLTIYHVESHPHRVEHRRLLDRVCNQVASVIRNSVLFEQMHQVSFTDSLTDLPNSRALFAYLTDRFVGADKQQVASALVMIDLDDFKAINDEYGHQVGDAVLRQVAAALRQNVRHTDFCARYAGDEFVVVFSDCGRREAQTRAAQIRAAIESAETDARPGVTLRPAVSVGVAVCPEDGVSYESLLTAADRRMYEDKQQRRLVCARDVRRTGRERASA